MEKLKSVTKEQLKAETNYVKFTMDYSTIVMAHDDFLVFAKAIGKAERYCSVSGYDNYVIKPLSKGFVSFEILSKEEYVLYKTAHLMGVDSSSLMKSI